MEEKVIDEFSKLFKVNIPVVKHTSYYLTTLEKAPYYKGAVEKFENFVNYYNKFSDPVKYKMTCLNQLVDKLSQSEAHTRIENLDFKNYKGLQKINRLKELAPTHVFFSVDLSSANFNTYKLFDSKNELGDTWEQFCFKNDIHPTLTSSKSFRQMVFGNLNPKRQQTLQAQAIIKLCNSLHDWCLLNAIELAYVNHDEAVFALDRKIWIKSSIDYEAAFNHVDIKFPKKVTEYSLEHISDDMFVKVYKDLSQSLIGVPGNQFYMYFKKYILDEAYDERDLFFVNDKKLAKWVEV